MSNTVKTINPATEQTIDTYTLLSQEEAEQMLESELIEYEGYVTKYVTVPLTQNQFDALVVWVYNLGPTNFRKSTLLKKLNSGDYTAAGQEITRWNKAGGKVLNGLVKRRKAEADGKVD
jgi:lysozyme